MITAGSGYLNRRCRTEAEYLAERAPYCPRCSGSIDAVEQCRDVNCPYFLGNHRP